MKHLAEIERQTLAGVFARSAVKYLLVQRT